MENETGMTTPPGFRPLYQQVHDLLRSRIANGIWRPSEALPSEQALAAELGVSQGTVRKALDALAADQLVERRQGKGTYVAQHTQESALFRFFRLARPRNGARVTPESRLLSVERRAALKADRERLQIAGRQDVMEARRVRMIDNRPLILETIIASLGDAAAREDRTVLRLGILNGARGMMFHTLKGLWYRLLVDAKLEEVERAMK